MFSRLSALYKYKDEVGKEIKPLSDLTFDDIQKKFEIKRAIRQESNKRNKKRYI